MILTWTEFLGRRKFESTGYSDPMLNMYYTHKEWGAGRLSVPDFHEGVQPEGHGSVSHEEGLMLAELAFIYGGPILEIGSDMGISTRYLLHGLEKRTHGMADILVAVDPYHKWHPDPVDAPRLLQLNGTTEDVFKRREIETFAYKFAFIDGDHRYRGVAYDIEVCKALKIPLMVFHDTRADLPVPTNTSDGSEARRAVEEYFPEQQRIELHTACGMMVAWTK